LDDAAATVAALDATERSESPTRFVAITLTVYVPGATEVNSVFVVVGVVLVTSLPAALIRYALYPVIALPPLLVGATQLAVTVVPLTVAEADVGAPGVVGTVTAEKDVTNELPKVFEDLIWNVYSDPAVKPVTTRVVRVFATVNSVTPVAEIL
jgi:hypothetical protein